MDDTRNHADENERTPKGKALVDASISDLVMQEAATAIETVGRELTRNESTSVREFLRGPALKVGLALSVLGVTLWIDELIQDHQSDKRQTRGKIPARRGSRRKSNPTLVV